MPHKKPSFTIRQRAAHYRRLWIPRGVNVCFYCVEIIKRKERSLDHLIAKSKGGKNTHANIVLCCRWCNVAKKDMSLAEFVDYVASNGGFSHIKVLAGWNKDDQNA